eukprot:scaffold176600_cov20-Tisochrysis_lutea.AAC.1
MVISATIIACPSAGVHAELDQNTRRLEAHLQDMQVSSPLIVEVSKLQLQELHCYFSLTAEKSQCVCTSAYVCVRQESCTYPNVGRHRYFYSCFARLLAKQDSEFTVQDGVLYMLQTRNGKRTGLAALT